MYYRYCCTSTVNGCSSSSHYYSYTSPSDIPFPYYTSGSYIHPCHYSCASCPNGVNICNSCKEGFHKKDGENGYCYSELRGYYLAGNSAFKKCENSCDTCFSSTENDCITCKTGYYFTEDSHLCRQNGINYYYLDSTSKILRKCHPNCLTCTDEPTESSMKCSQCKPDYFPKEDNLNSCYNGQIDYYYKDGNIYRKCGNNCLKCNSYKLHLLLKNNISDNHYDIFPIF